MQPQRANNMGIQKITVPELCGVAIPTNQRELMKMIQMKNRLNAAKSATNPEDPKFIKQEQERENVERKLMEFEDYTFKPEGFIRFKRILDTLNR